MMSRHFPNPWAATHLFTLTENYKNTVTLLEYSKFFWRDKSPETIFSICISDRQDFFRDHEPKKCLRLQLLCLSNLHRILLCPFILRQQLINAIE